MLDTAVTEWNRQSMLEAADKLKQANLKRAKTEAKPKPARTRISQFCNQAPVQGARWKPIGNGLFQMEFV